MHYTDELYEWYEIREQETIVEATANPLEFLDSDAGPLFDGNCYATLIHDYFKSFPLNSDRDSLLDNSLVIRDWPCSQDKLPT